MTGVVHPHGCGGLANRLVGFSFETWRGEDGVLHSSELKLHRHVTSEELHSYMNRINSYEIVSAWVVFTEWDNALLLGLLEEPVNLDDALVQRVAELLKPKTVEHEIFGTLTLDRELDWFRGTISWAGKDVELNLPASDDIALQEGLQVALKLWNEQTSWNEQRDIAVQKKLDWYNNGWRQDDDPELTPEEFKSKVVLEAITVYPNGMFEFSHDADYLLGYHTVRVEGSLQDGLTGVYI